jgi:hypothetical protein
MFALLALAALASVTQAAPALWKPYASPTGAYSISFPGKPTEKKQTLALPDGVKLEIVVASVKRGSATSYSVASGLLDSAPDSPKLVLDLARDDVVKSLKGTLTGETSRDGARELKIEIPKAIVAGGANARARIQMIGNRLYEVVAVQSSIESKMQSADVDRFFLSFQPAGKIDGELRVEVDDTPPKTGASGGGTSVPATNWEKFSSSGGRYSVLMIGKPTEKTEKGNMTLLGPTESRYAMVKLGAHHTLSVMYQDFVSGEFGKGDLEQIYDNARAAALSNVKGKLLRSKKVTLGDLIGRELKIEMPRSKIPGGGIMHARYFFKGQRFYQVIFLAPKAEYNSDDADKFLDSFKIESP